MINSRIFHAIDSEKYLIREYTNGDTRSIRVRNPYIEWRHVEGPALITSFGEVHWLTLWERFKLAMGLITLENLNESMQEKFQIMEHSAAVSS